MKAFTSILSVNRLLSSLFTFILISSAVLASAKQVSYNMPVTSGVKYATLVASASDKSVMINWSTVSEENNSHFEVERSSDMKDFKTVAIILDGFSSTASISGKTYKFKEDAGDVRKGKTVYYRLKQIDTDYQVHYSSVMAVQINATVSVFPNQEASVLKTENSNNNNDINKVESEYSTGKILLSKQSTVNVGFINISVEDKLSTGIFA